MRTESCNYPTPTHSPNQFCSLRLPQREDAASIVATSVSLVGTQAGRLRLRWRPLPQNRRGRHGSYAAINLPIPALLFAILTATVPTAWPEEAAPRYKVDPKYLVDGEYRGRFAPDADYVLSGQFREDLGPLPEVQFRYLTDDEGYDPKALTPVPPLGVHPRVLMSPEDLVRIRAELAKGDKADRFFQIVWNDIKAATTMQHLHGLTSRALFALITEDEALGKDLAARLVEYAKFVEPAIDLMNTHPDVRPQRDWWYYYSRTSVAKVGGEHYKDAYEKGGAELIRELAKKGVEFSAGGGGKTSGHLFNTVLKDYDYLHPFMADEQRAYVRKVIATASAGKFTAGMGLPGHWFINNHMSMGEDLLILHLAIEGEEGYDPRILKQYAPAVRDKITYDVSEAGIMQEKLKGFLPERAAVAIARRADLPGAGALPLLRHDHLKAFIWAKALDSVHIHTGNHNLGAPELGELDTFARHWWQGYGSGPWMDQYFNWAFVLRLVYPRDPVVDYFYKERLRDNGFGPARPEPGAPLPKTRIRYTWRDLMLLGATDGLRHPDGRVIDYDQDGLPKELVAENKAFADMRRGVAVARSSWDKDAMTVHYECRSDIYGGGHETPEAQDFNLSSHGVVWSMRREWYMDCYFRNMVLIDGKAGVYGPTPGKLMEVIDNEAGATFVSDATVQYNWGIGGKCFVNWHRMYDEAPLHMDGMRSAETWARGTELGFLPHARLQEQNFAGLDWGGWHGEERGPNPYHRWNDIDHVFRTMHMTKGDTPYLLIVDDVRKDDEVHQYDWCFHLERDIALYSADSAVRNRYLINFGVEVPNMDMADLILCLRDVPETRYYNYGIRCHRKPEKGNPMLLVRVLSRNTEYPYPQPVFEEGVATGGTSLGARIRVPALAVDPEFRVLIFPHRFGEKLPLTTWNADRSQLTVLVGGHEDVYTFGKTDRERTVLTMSRDGKLMTRTGPGPAAPMLDTPHGWTVDQNFPDAPRTVLVAEGDAIALKQPPLGQVIRYTLDGSEPNETSPLYTSPFSLPKSCALKARAFARYWPFADSNVSEVLELRIEKRLLAASPRPDTRDLTPGLACEVFEKHHTIYDEKTGIFTGTKKMLPDLAGADRILACRAAGFDIPAVEGRLPAREQAKAYYRYEGSFETTDDGVHGFRVHSCGPVTLKVAGQDALNVTGSYGLSLKSRYGQAALKAGRHAFELVVRDPSFWKAGREGPYPLEVGVLAPGAADYEALRGLATDRIDLAPLPTPKIPAGKAVKPGKAVPGLVLSAYDRVGSEKTIPGDGLPAEHFSTKGQKAYSSRPVLSLAGSDSVGRLAVYEGFLVADVPGTYAFQLDEKGANQLWVDGALVQQNRVDAPPPAGAITLEAGFHTFSLRLSKSSPILRVKAPGSDQFVPAAMGMFVRPADAKSHSDGRLLLHLDGESLGTNGELENSASGATAKLRKGKLVTGKTGQGIKITGEDSRLEVEGLRTPEDALSVSYWIRVDKNKDRNLLDCSWGSHPGGRLRHYIIWAFYFRGGPNASFDLSKVGARKGEWCHVTITYGPAVRLYVNGELRDWSAKEVAARRAYVTDIFLFSGLDATVDDVRLYNRVLSAEDVRRLAK